MNMYREDPNGERKAGSVLRQSRYPVEICRGDLADAPVMPSKYSLAYNPSP